MDRFADEGVWPTLQVAPPPARRSADTTTRLSKALEARHTLFS
jgi:hypothetical protein